MGFFGWLKDKLIDAAVVVTSPVWLPASVAVMGAVEAGKKIGLISDDIGKTEALTETSTVSQVEKMSQDVRKYYNDYKPKAETKEEIAQKNIEILFNDIKAKFQEERQLANDYGMSTLDRKKDRLCRDIEGTITDAIRTKLSLDDSECKKILSMPAGDEKLRKMNEFAERTIQNANKDLENKIRTAMREVKDDITRFLQNKMDEQEEKAQRDQQEFDNWIRQIENKTFDSERAQLEPRIKIYAIEQVEKILAA